MRTSRLALVSTTGVLFGCVSDLDGLLEIGDEVGETTSQDSGSDGETGSDGEADSTGEADSDSEADSTTEESGTEAICGDGNLDPGEFCDDGNLDGLDGCNAHCTEPGIALWSRVFVADWGAAGWATGDVDGSIYFVNRFDGMHALDHLSGEPSGVNFDLQLIGLRSQDPGRFVGLDGSEKTVVGIDATGDVLWSHAMIGHVYSFAVDGMGNVVAVDDDGTLGSWDANGSENWKIDAPTPPPPLHPIVTADPDGIYLVGGQTPEVSLYGLDTDGNLVWQTPIDWDGEVVAMAAASGQIAMVGAEYAPPSDENYGDFSIHAYDSSNGQLAWTDRIDGPGIFPDGDDDVGRCVAFDPAGNVLVAGTLGLADTENAMWVARYSPDGTLLWSATLDDGAFHYCESLTALPDGDVLLSETWHADDPLPEVRGRVTLFMP